MSLVLVHAVLVLASTSKLSGLLNDVPSRDASLDYLERVGFFHVRQDLNNLGSTVDWAAFYGTSQLLLGGLLIGCHFESSRMPPFLHPPLPRTLT